MRNFEFNGVLNNSHEWHNFEDLNTEDMQICLLNCIRSSDLLYILFRNCKKLLHLHLDLSCTKSVTELADIET